MRLPTKLGREPLVDMVFEMRFKASLPASNLLPGILFGALGAESAVERLPVADLPEPIRKADPNLAYAPLVRIHWADKYVVLIGDRAVILGCKLPYRGWGEFKPAIEKVVGIVEGAKIVTSVERCSIKAVNVVPAEIGAPKDVMIADMTIAGYDLLNGIFDVRAEKKGEGMITIVRLATEATANHPNGTKTVGPLIEADTILELSDVSTNEFVKQLPQHLEKIHDATKKMFFSCLQNRALEQLEPSYD